MRETAAEVIERHLLPEDRELRSVCELAEHLLPRGVGMHHGGMLPVLHELADQFFKDGCIKVLFTIETFALGLNMPSRALMVMLMMMMMTMTMMMMMMMMPTVIVMVVVLVVMLMVMMLIVMLMMMVVVIIMVVVGWWW